MRFRNTRSSLRSRRRRSQTPVVAEVLEDRTLLSGGSLLGLDATFGNSGITTSNFGGSDNVRDVAAYLQTGKMVVVGESGGDMAVAMYKEDGTLDTDFGDMGLATVEFGSEFSVANSVVVDSNGNIIVAGTVGSGTTSDFAVAVFDGTGNEVTSFGNASSASAPAGAIRLDIAGLEFGDSEQDEAFGVTVDASDNILVSGISRENDGMTVNHTDFAIVRLNKIDATDGVGDGEFDTTFDSDGIWTDDFSGASSQESNGAIAVAPNSDIVIAGNSSNKFAVVRLNQDGSHDTDFDVDGRVSVNFLGIGSANSVVVDSTNRTLVAGQTFSLSQSSKVFVAVAAIQETGVLDSSFKDSGKATYVFADGNDANSASSIALDATQVVNPAAPAELKIVIGGTSASNLAVARLDVNGEFDTTSGQFEDATEVIAIAGADTGDGIAVDHQGRIVLAGTTESGPAPANNFIVTRFTGGSTNSPPTAHAGGPYEANEGDSFQLNAGLSDDPDAEHDFGDLTFEWDLNFDGSFDATPGVTGATPTVSFADDFSMRNIAVRVTDPCDDSSIAVTTLKIDNVAPTIDSATAPTIGVRGQAQVFTDVVVTDPGVLDDENYSWSVVVDGNTITGTDSSFSFTPTVNGTYTVTLTVDDGDGGSDTETYDVVISAVNEFDFGIAIGGTTGNDKIRITPSSTAGSVDVKIDNQLIGTYALGTDDRIVVYAQAGDDDVIVAGSITNDAWLFGGDGNDKLKGGKGNDVIVGGGGNDLLKGRAGRDLMIGGDGADRMVGNKDEDILIAAYTTIDNDLVALQAIMDEWTKPDPFENRVPVVSALLDGKVIDDGHADVMTGGQGLDWFVWNDEVDCITDLNDCSFEGDLDWILNEGEED